MADPAQDIEPTYADTLAVPDEPRSSLLVLESITQAERAFQPYYDICRRVDDAYGRVNRNNDVEWNDREYDLFWASMEILKPAIYARPPVPVVTTKFKDRNRTATTAAELLERCLISTLDRSNINDSLLAVRDDLIFANRGVMWVTYESDAKGGGQRVCIENLDRMDYMNEPARYWSEVGIVYRRAWLTETEARKRFQQHSGDAYRDAAYVVREDERDGRSDKSLKAGFWEVWHKADDRVYWVTEGVSVMLDEGEPHLKVDGFFPSPRPAYGTLQRRSLLPIPDYERYARHFDQIDELTNRIYALLDMVKIKAFIPAGSDVGAAVETALKATDSSIIVPVPAAALVASSTSGFIQFMPLTDIATTIQGLIEARNQLFQDFFQLSGISDIMRGATEAEETLGAQKIKTQYGSIRVKDKVDEIQRLARDVCSIAAEIIAEKFTQETLLDMSQMEIPTKGDVKKQVSELEAAAKKELTALAEQAKEMAAKAQAGGQQIDPKELQAAEQQFTQAQQEIIGRYGPQIKQAGEQVVIEDVMKLLRDNKTRGFVIDIETDSTILVDEEAEKASRVEFLQAFTQVVQAVQPLLMAGKAGADLSGAMIKFGIVPFRAGRELDGLIDAFVDEAPAALAAQQGTGEADKALADANAKIADAEVMKAQAATERVQMDAQAKMQEMQLKAAESQQKAQADMQKLQLQVAEAQEKARAAQAKSEQDAALMEAQINKLTADTAKILASIGLDERKQKLSEYTAETQAQQQQVDTALQAEAQSTAAQQGERQAGMQERSQEFQERDTERKQDFAEQSGDRQMTLAERSADRD